MFSTCVVYFWWQNDRPIAFSFCPEFRVYVWEDVGGGGVRVSQIHPSIHPSVLAGCWAWRLSHKSQGLMKHLKQKHVLVGNVGAMCICFGVFLCKYSSQHEVSARCRSSLAVVNIGQSNQWRADNSEEAQFPDWARSRGGGLINFFSQ